MSRPTSSSAGAGGGARGRGVGTALATMTEAGCSIVPLRRPSTEGCHPVGETTTASTAGRDVTGSTSASGTARCSATGVVGRGTGTGNSRILGAPRAWDRGPSGAGEVKGPCRCKGLFGCAGPRRCVARGRLPEAAGRFRQVSGDLAPVDRRAARTVGPPPAGATAGGVERLESGDAGAPVEGARQHDSPPALPETRPAGPRIGRRARVAPWRLRCTVRIP
jgi:hypothetical protein